MAAVFIINLNGNILIGSYKFSYFNEKYRRNKSVFIPRDRSAIITIAFLLLIFFHVCTITLSISPLKTSLPRPITGEFAVKTLKCVYWMDGRGGVE